MQECVQANSSVFFIFCFLLESGKQLICTCSVVFSQVGTRSIQMGDSCLAQDDEIVLSDKIKKRIEVNDMSENDSEGGSEDASEGEGDSDEESDADSEEEDAGEGSGSDGEQTKGRADQQTDKKDSSSEDVCVFFGI